MYASVSLSCSRRMYYAFIIPHVVTRGTLWSKYLRHSIFSLILVILSSLKTMIDYFSQFAHSADKCL